MSTPDDDKRENTAVRTPTAPRETPRQTQHATPSRPLSALRIPVLVVMGLSIAAGVAKVAPPPVMMSLAALVAGVWAVSLERVLIVELLQWRRLTTFLAPVLAMGLVALSEWAMGALTAAALQGGAEIDLAHPPRWLLWLGELREAMPVNGTLWWAVALAPVVAVGFELFFRGFVMTRLMVHFAHGWAVVVSALLLGLAYYLSLGALAGIIALIGGLGAALLLLFSRSLVPPALLHLLFIQGAILLVALPA